MTSRAAETKEPSKKTQKKNKRKERNNQSRPINGRRSNHVPITSGDGGRRKTPNRKPNKTQPPKKNTSTTSNNSVKPRKTQLSPLKLGKKPFGFRLNPPSPAKTQYNQV